MLRGVGVGRPRSQDATTPTGKRVVYPVNTVPVDRRGRPFTPDAWSQLDGFSTSTTAMTLLPNASVELTPGLPGWETLLQLAGEC